jgi:hypothetical protein
VHILTENTSMFMGAKYPVHPKKIMIIKKRLKKSDFFGNQRSCIKIFHEKITIMVSGVKKTKSIKPHVHVHHAIFVINLSFFAQDTIKIISSPNNFIRVQYLIIFCFQEDSDFFLSIFKITTNFRIYEVHSTHMPKIRAHILTLYNLSDFVIFV